MKKYIGIVGLSFMLFVSTGCVSETLGLNSISDVDNIEMRVSQRKLQEGETKALKKIEDINNGREEIVDNFFDKIFKKIGINKEE